MRGMVIAAVVLYCAGAAALMAVTYTLEIRKASEGRIISLALTNGRSITFAAKPERPSPTCAEALQVARQAAATRPEVFRGGEVAADACTRAPKTTAEVAARRARSRVLHLALGAGVLLAMLLPVGALFLRRTLAGQRSLPPIR